MTTPRIRVEGADDLRRALRGVEAGMSDLKSVHAAAAKPVVDRAQQIVPTGRTGRLGASIRAGAQARQAVIRAGKAAVPYAGPIHFGWRARNIRPQPFLYDALDDRSREVIAIYESGVGDILKRNKLD